LVRPIDPFSPIDGRLAGVLPRGLPAARSW